MPLKTKDLENFLWEQPRACEARGLALSHAFYALGRRYRHLALGPCGRAQQVSVRFEPSRNCFHVQLLACVGGAFTAVEYTRVQHQLEALRYLLEGSTRAADGAPVRVQTSCVLLGQQLRLSGDLARDLAGDNPHCRAFTYRYGLTGVRFEQIAVQGFLWPEMQAGLSWLRADLLAERADALSIAEASRPHELAGLAAAPPLALADLVVTPGGVLANPTALR